MQPLLNFVAELEEMGIYYELNSFRSEAIMVSVHHPGAIFEVEFMDDGSVVFEEYRSTGDVVTVDPSDLLHRWKVEAIEAEEVS